MTQTNAQRLADDEFVAIPFPGKDFARIIMVKSSGSEPPLTNDEKLLLALHTENAQLRAELEAVRRDARIVSASMFTAIDALDEIALAGMSGTGQESEEGMTAWHASQAWKFIGIAARAKSAIDAAQAERAKG